MPELAKIRQTWILVRNERPTVPSFCKAPMPDRKNGNEERNARIVMTYFHPFTLQKDAENPEVPYVSRLRRQAETWQEALLVWLEGNVLTHEARNTIQNFFFVAQMRPDFLPDANKNDEDVFSDEEIDRDKTDIQTLLHTHSGNTKDNKENEGIEDAATYVNSRDAMDRACRLWTQDKEKLPKTADGTKSKREFQKVQGRRSATVEEGNTEIAESSN